MLKWQFKTITIEKSVSSKYSVDKWGFNAKEQKNKGSVDRESLKEGSKDGGFLLNWPNRILLKAGQDLDNKGWR